MQVRVTLEVFERPALQVGDMPRSRLQAYCARMQLRAVCIYPCLNLMGTLNSPCKLNAPVLPMRERFVSASPWSKHAQLQ